METFAKRFQDALNLRGMKQVDIVNLTKIGKSSISTYLSGEYEPKQRNIFKIAKALDVDEGWLMGFDVPMERKPDKERSDTSNILLYVQGRSIPIIGSIPAGSPALAVENIVGHDYADVPEGEDYFYLRVNGDSMTNAGIHSDDLVLIKMQPCAENGQIVACMINGEEATLKRYYRQKNTVVLQPENPAYQPIIVPCKDFESGYARIIGIAKEVKRKL